MFKLLVITPPEPVTHEPRRVVELFEAGLQNLHLRKPGATRAEVEAYLRALPWEWHRQIMLHQHHDLVEKYGLQGAHLPAAERETWAGRLAAHQRLSTSLHGLAEVEQVEEGRYDYVFLSPIFNSISKAGYPAAFTPEQLQTALLNWKQQGRRVPPVLALGGVDATTLPSARELGFAGAAVLGAVWQHPDPVAAFRALLWVAEQP